jgi:hypothetical protein
MKRILLTVAIVVAIDMAFRFNAPAVVQLSLCCAGAYVWLDRVVRGKAPKAINRRMTA